MQFKNFCSVILVIDVLVQCWPTDSRSNNVANDLNYQKNYNTILSEILGSNTSQSTPNYTDDSDIIPSKIQNSAVMPDITKDDNRISNKRKCGIRNIKLKLTPRSVNGEPSQITELPWQISLLMNVNNKSKEFMFNGGGSIIHPSIVITIAHRVINITADRLRVRAGQTNLLNDNEINRQDRNVSKIIIHENFILKDHINDIALLILEKPLIFTSYVSPICLPPVNMNFDNDLCIVSGWGKNQFGENGKYQPELQKLNLSIIPHNQCRRAYQNIGFNQLNLTSFICGLGESNRDSCTGDGGSPLVCPVSQNSKQYYQIGIVAIGYQCGLAGIPGLYTDIAKMRSWIDQQVELEEFDISSYTYSD